MYGMLSRVPKMVGPRVLVFRPLVEGNKALGTRLNRDLIKAHDFFLLDMRNLTGGEEGNFQGQSVLECWSRGTKNLGSRLK